MVKVNTKRKCYLDIDHVSFDAVSRMLEYLQNFDIESLLEDLNCVLSFSMLVLLDFLGVRQEAEEFMKPLIVALEKYIVIGRSEEYLAFLNFYRVLSFKT